MKKNMFMRLAMALVLLVLVTTSAVGGTYAKYTTSADKTDTARVAKWGVQLAIAGDSMFDNEYATEDTKYTGAVSVKSVDDKTIVAPGTKGSVQFAISGKPEVATRVVIGLTNTKDVFLKAGTYTDPTWAGVDTPVGTFVLSEDYYPVKWTLEQTASATGDLMPTVEGKLSDITAALAAYSGTASTPNAQYAPNTDLDATFKLSWEWTFDNGTTGNQADTYLGNLAAGLNPDSLAAANYSTDINYYLSLTVEQID